MLQVTMMAPAVSDGSNCPADVLIVEDDPIIAIDFEDRLLGFGVKSVRTVGSVAQALTAIAAHAPEFALLDVGLSRENSFAVAERLAALKIPFVFVTGYGADARIPPEFAPASRDCRSRVRATRWRRRSRSARRTSDTASGRLRIERG
ncbi:CheY-like chemotaxis protein [Bradyrhizobium sp. GM6.1]